MLYWHREMDALQREIEHGVEVLRNGGVIAYPTDTVYGLGADAFNTAAVDRIYEIKGRPRERQLPLLIADEEYLPLLVEPVPDMARFLAGRFWPGALTMVFPAAPSLPAHLATGPGIAVRLPDHAACLALIRGLGNPVIGTSANLSGRGPALTAAEVRQQLGSRIDLVIDGGGCRGGRESTVIDVTGRAPLVLREGIITAHEIERAYEEYLEVSNEAHYHRR
ncbi:MAG: L-threonylcarbamoyladenylate synthase [Dehalococcoidia bacterium]